MYSALCIFKLFVCTYYIHQSSQCHQEEAFSINFIFMILKILRLAELNNLYTRESDGVNTKSQAFKPSSVYFLLYHKILFFCPEHEYWLKEETKDRDLKDHIKEKNN